MILVKLNQPEFEYDIHSLIKAFYPKQNVSVTAEEKNYDEPIVLEFQVTYADDYIHIAWKENIFAKMQEGVEPSEEEKPIQTIILPEVKFEINFSDRKETKNQLKQHLYQMLSEHTKEVLPWGTLTGIRPTKIPMKFLEEGKSRCEIASYMKETYFASDEKIELSIDIAKRELALLKQIDYEEGYSLYIGIPFCPTTCLYCSFTSYPLTMWRNQVDAYLDAL